MKVLVAAGWLLFSVVLLPPAGELVTLSAAAQSATASAPTGILNREQASAILPEKVFYRGLSAPIQARNSAGVRFADSKLMLAALVDTSGYSTAVKENYQAYLIVEMPMRFGDKTLQPGAYGFGFISNDSMIVLDIGANQLFTTATTPDAKLARPTPLQVLPDPSSTNRYRLYLGRSYVPFEAASGQN